METQKKSRTTAKISLPKEIIAEEILSRLPVKSILRFRCVSKSWHSLLGSERFIKTQHQNSIQRVILHNKGALPKQCSLQSLLSEEPIDPSPLDHPTIGPLMSFRVLGCYNGLVCFLKFRREFWLWNPSTRISMKLSEIEIVDGRFVQNCGFGWDESSGEYKVFALVRDWDLRSHKGRVYSSKTKSWKTIEYNLTGVPYSGNTAGVFVGGKLHWRNPRNNDVVIFDLKSEVFGKIELPFDKGNKLLGQIGGCLCVLLCHNRWRKVRVWVMKESWERLVDLSLDHELLQRPVSTSFIQKGSHGKIFVFDGSTLLVYDPQDNAFRFPEVCRGYAAHHVYFESLLSPEDL